MLLGCLEEITALLAPKNPDKTHQNSSGEAKLDLGRIRVVFTMVSEGYVTIRGGSGFVLGKYMLIVGSVTSVVSQRE